VLGLNVLVVNVLLLNSCAMGGQYNLMSKYLVGETLHIYDIFTS